MVNENDTGIALQVDLKMSTVKPLRVGPFTPIGLFLNAQN